MDTKRNRVSPDDFEDFRQEATRLGFLDLKAAQAAPVECAEFLREWVTQGFHAGMDWFARNLDRRLDPRRVLSGAESVLVLAAPHHSDPCTLAEFKLARYACGDDYHEVLGENVMRLCRTMKDRYQTGTFRAYVDTGPVLERYWAEKAGLGWIGKNGCLIVPKIGSYLFLACIITDLVFPYGKTVNPSCGTCQACLDACPTKAIVSPAVVDANRCISYLNIEHRGPFSSDVDLSGWVFGCDACQEVCPWNIKFASCLSQPEFQPRQAYERLIPEDLVQLEQTGFSCLFKRSPIKRVKLDGLKRNVRSMGDRERVSGSQDSKSEPLSDS